MNTSKIKVVAIITIALFSFFNSNAQKCKFDYEKEDPFSGKATKGNTSAIYPASPVSNEYWYLGLNRTGDDFYIGMLVQLKGELNTYLEKGDSIMFKLANGAVITCYANDKVSPTTNAAAAGGQPIITTQYRANYAVTAEELKNFSESMVTFVRMNVGDKVFQVEIKEKHAKKLLDNAACILK